MPSQTKQAHCKRCVFILYQTKNHRLPPRLFYRAKAKITSVKNRKDQKKKGRKKTLKADRKKGEKKDKKPPTNQPKKQAPTHRKRRGQKGVNNFFNRTY
jgi:hypothetical protein